jgi:hypothetical protein
VKAYDQGGRGESPCPRDPPSGGFVTQRIKGTTVTDPNLPEQPANPVPPVPPAAAPAAPPAYGTTPPAAPAYGETAPAYGQPAYGQPGTGPAKTNVLAIVSLVSAFFVSLAAIITGHIALSQIKKTGEQGRGLAIAGLIIGYIGLVVGIIVLIFWIVALTTFANNPELVY